jgi:hypothetical protein
MRRSRVVFFLWVLASLGLICSGLKAQDVRARVQGLVVDSSQAAIVGANVTLVNVKTGVKMTRLTNDTGRYRFDYVDPGVYTITMESTGFSRFTQENFDISAQGDVTVDATLKPGAVQESVTVSGNVVEIQFNNSNSTMTIDTKLTAELPRFERNPFKLTLLMPSAVETRRNEMNPYNSWAPNSVELGGGTSLKNDLQVDGSPIGIGYKGAWVPNTDAVMETTVQKNSVDADMGHSAGGTVSIATKAGTNEIHGIASWLGRQPALNAVTDRTTGAKTNARNNIYGVSAGGPILKNKLFTFFSWEVQKPRSLGSVLWTVPTALERGGDFSQSLNRTGTQRTIYDPFSTVFDPVAGKATRTPFPGNVITADRFDPLGARLLTAMRAFEPNRRPDNVTGLNNFSEYTRSFTDYYDISDRVDWYVNDKWRIFARPSVYRTNVLTHPPDYFLTAPASDIYVQTGSKRYGTTLGGQAIWTVNTTTVVDFRGDWRNFGDLSYSPSENGPSPMAKLWPTNNWYNSFQYAPGEFPNYMPGILLEGATTWGRGNAVNWNQQPNGESFGSKIMHQRGAHNLKAGFEYRHLGGHLVTMSGNQFNFSNAMTAETFLSPNTTLNGDSFATLLLGALDDNLSQATKAPYQQNRLSYYGAFIQDDYKLSRDITLNLGLRWEYETPWHDPLNQLSVGPDFTVNTPGMAAAQPNIPSSVTSMLTVPYSYTGSWVFTSKDQGTWRDQKLVLMPRVGVAVKINNKTALRFGYARYVIPSELNFQSTPYQGYQNLTFLQPPQFGYDQVQSPLPLSNGIPQAVLSNPFPASYPLVPIAGKDLGAAVGLGSPNMVWGGKDFTRPVNDRLNLNISHQLPNRIVFEASGFANFGNNLNYLYNDNQVDPRAILQYKGATSASIANPFYQYLTPKQFPGPLRNQKTVTVSTLLRQRPQYGNMWEGFKTGTKNRYYSLDLKLQRSFSNGFNLMFGYAYIREKANLLLPGTEGPVTYFLNDLDNYNNVLHWIDSASPHHRVTAAGTYQLPFGKGRAFLSSAPRVLEAALGGWQIIGSWYFNSGPYLQFPAALVSGDPTLSNPTPKRWFDTSMFKVLPAYTLRLNPVMYPGIRGPIYWEMQGNLSKRFTLDTIREGMALELRGSAYNLTNRLNLANPDLGITSASFGQSLRQFGSVTGRQIELGARIVF